MSRGRGHCCCCGRPSPGCGRAGRSGGGVVVDVAGACAIENISSMMLEKCCEAREVKWCCWSNGWLSFVSDLHPKWRYFWCADTGRLGGSAVGGGDAMRSWAVNCRVESRWSRTQQARIRRVQWHDPGQRGLWVAGVMVSMQWEGKHARTRFFTGQVLYDCGVPGWCFDLLFSQHAWAPIPQNWKRCIVQNTGQANERELDGHRHSNLGVIPSTPTFQGHSSREPSTVVQRPNSLSYRIRQGQNSLPSIEIQSARAASERSKPTPPPILPRLAVVAIPSSSSYPPFPVSRRPLPPPPPPWRPTAASLARCMFIPSVFIRDWPGFHS